MNSEDLIRDRIITRLIAGIRQEDPSPEEVRTAVGQLKRRLGSRLVPDHSRAQPSLRTRHPAGPTLWRRPILRLGIAAAVVGSVTLWHWMPTRQVGAGVVFGQVLQVVRQATTMTYTLIEDAPGEGKDILQVQVRGLRWLRLDSAGTGTRILDLQDSKLLRFDHPQQPAMHADLITLVGPAAQALQSTGVTLTDFNDLQPGDGQPLGHKMIAGQAVTGFRIRRQSLVDDLEDRSVWEVWADSETAQPVRVDIHHERDQVRVTLVDFNFDVEFEDSLFDLQPPPGYTVAYETIAEIESGDGQ